MFSGGWWWMVGVVVGWFQVTPLPTPLPTLTSHSPSYPLPFTYYHHHHYYYYYHSDYYPTTTYHSNYH